ncbi:zinc finger MYM-type protein 1-like [Hyperolius riggenbachi]|uniref:zinc finger MYM-type protein 1-like n=1 Tax=Hyperolius riggenbachi TaxID=752182 RepID=UPI0035A2BF45
MSDGRKRLSGAAYKKKREAKASALAKQKGSMLKFLSPETSEGTTQPEETQASSSDTGGSASIISISHSSDLHIAGDESSRDTSQVSTSATSRVQMDVEMEEETEEQTLSEESQFDPSVLQDPGLWMDLSSKLRDYLVLHGPKQVKLARFPKDKKHRSLHRKYYKRHLPNLETAERQWLMYSESRDAVFCFCCKLFPPKVPVSLLCSTGFSDWSNLIRNLESHERAEYHTMAFHKWKDLEIRLRLGLTIADTNRELIDSETQHWRKVLKRLMVLVRTMAMQNLAFRGNSDKIFQPNNGNFLKLVEAISEFDEQIKEKILAHLHAAKYYSIILDCTPDISHKEQMTLIVRFVTATESTESNSAAVSIKEHFLTFIDIDDTTGAGMTTVLLQELESFGISVHDMRGQGYDNGSNMKGKINGVQAQVRRINSQAFYVPCSSHSLNLVVSDAASTCIEAVEFFNIIQSLYVFFFCFNTPLDCSKGTPVSNTAMDYTQAIEHHSLGEPN